MLGVSWEIEEVYISDCEWADIVSFNKKRIEKVAFICLVYSKIFKQKNKYANVTYSNILTEALSQVTDETKGVLDCLTNECNYLTRLIDNKFAYKINREYVEDKTKIVINNFNNVISYYDEHRNDKKYIECEVCNKRIIKGSHNSKYCNKCAKKINSENSIKRRGKNTNKDIKYNDCFGVIYLIQNTKNDKVYIGQTTRKRGFKDRYACAGEGIERVYGYHSYRKNIGDTYNEHLLNSIEKYGFDSFVVHEVYDVAETQEELDELEALYINKFNSTSNQFGYNHTEGGGGGRHSEEAKTRDRQGTPIRCLNDGKEFKSQKDAYEYYGIDKKSFKVILSMKYLPENYIRFSNIINKNHSKYCKFCGREMSEGYNSTDGYCKPHDTESKRLKLIKSNININGEIKNKDKLYLFDEVMRNINT